MNVVCFPPLQLHTMLKVKDTMKFVVFHIMLQNYEIFFPLWRVILRVAISELKTRWK